MIWAEYQQSLIDDVGRILMVASPTDDMGGISTVAHR